MNERYKELAREAGLLVHNPENMPTKLSAFAELIVQECIDTVSDCSVEYCTRPQIVSEIKQHFGVEE